MSKLIRFDLSKDNTIVKSNAITQEGTKLTSSLTPSLTPILLNMLGPSVNSSIPIAASVGWSDG